MISSTLVFKVPKTEPINCAPNITPPTVHPITPAPIIVAVDKVASIAEFKKNFLTKNPIAPANTDSINTPIFVYIS